MTWLARTPAFAPMEYSKIGLEQFTPDYTRYFHGLPQATRDRLLPRQWQLYKGVSGDTLGDIHDELYRRSLGGGWPDVTLTPGIEVTGAAVTGAGRIELGVEHGQQEARGGSSRTPSSSPPDTGSAPSTCCSPLSTRTSSATRPGVHRSTRPNGSFSHRR